MHRDAVLAGPTAQEIVALARLANDLRAAPPPHIVRDLREKGWIISAPDGSSLLTLAGRTLADRAGASISVGA